MLIFNIYFKKQVLDIIFQEEIAIELLKFNILSIIVDIYSIKFFEFYDLFKNYKNVVDH